MPARTYVRTHGEHVLNIPCWCCCYCFCCCCCCCTGLIDVWYMPQVNEALSEVWELGVWLMRELLGPKHNEHLGGTIQVCVLGEREGVTNRVLPYNSAVTNRVLLYLQYASFSQTAMLGFGWVFFFFGNVRKLKLHNRYAKQKQGKMKKKWKKIVQTTSIIMPHICMKGGPWVLDKKKMRFFLAHEEIVTKCFLLNAQFLFPRIQTCSLFLFIYNRA